MTTADGLDVATLWTAAGVVAGFAFTGFLFRIQREAAIREEGRRHWLPPADFVLIVSFAVVLVGVFVLPVLGADLLLGQYSLGWGFLLLAGYPFALAGHYDIVLGKTPKSFAPHRKRNPPWCTRQERVAILVIAVASVAYLGVVLGRELL